MPRVRKDRTFRVMNFLRLSMRIAMAYDTRARLTMDIPVTRMGFNPAAEG